MEFWLQKDNDSKFQLPVNPSKFTVTVVNKNTVVNVIQLGDINLIGKSGLREVSLSSFFPARVYNFSNMSTEKDPMDYVRRIETWRNAGEPIRVIITGTINMECTIESFSYGEQDATRDIYYTIALKEYRKPKVVTVVNASNTGGSNTGASSTGASSTEAGTTSTRTTQPEDTNSGKTYTVKSGDSLWKIAKQFYGNGANYTKIYEANKDKIKNPSLIYAGQVLTIP